MRSPLSHLFVWVSLLLLALTGYGIWYGAIASESRTVAGLEDQIQAKTEAASRVTSARAAFAEIAGDEAAVEDYFVPEMAVVPFIEDLEARARALGASMKILSVSVGTAAQTPTLVLSLAVGGTFDAVMRTVGAVEYAPYDLVISRLAVAKGGKTEWDASFDVTVGSVPGNTATTTPHTP